MTRSDQVRELFRDALSGRISRREVMKRGAALGMSGSYRLQKFIDGQFSDDLYFASPLDFVPGLDGPQLDTLRQRKVILASGEGAWENIGESWALADVLGAKGVPNRVDSWGPDFEHDWPTWWRMLPQYLEELC